MHPIPRSALFTPATKTTHFGTAATVGADAVILDLEDSVAPRDKTTARELALDYLANTSRSEVATALRINAPDTLDGWRDLSALLDSEADPDFVVIPKADSAATADLVKRLLRQANKSCRIIVIAETAVAANHPARLCDAQIVDAVLFGAADMCADLGADPDSAVSGYARSALLAAAAEAGVPIIDAPHFDVEDESGLRTAAAAAVAEGFAGKAAIHPKQVSAINAAFTPTDARVDWAKEVLSVNDAGTGTVDGVMVDEAVARRAQTILNRIR